MNEDEEGKLVAELTEAAEGAATALRRLTAVLRRIELVNSLQQLEAAETARALLGEDTAESEMAEAAIARARSPG